MRSFGAIATLLGSILYGITGLVGRLLVDIGNDTVKLHELALVARSLAALSLLIFYVGLYDVVARFENPDPGSAPRTRIGSSSVVLGGGVGLAGMFVGNAMLANERTLLIGMLAIAAASLPLALTCIGAPLSLNSGGAQALLPAALGLVAAFALVLAGLLPMIPTEQLEGVDLIKKTRPMIHPFGTLANVCGVVYGLWVFVTGIIVYRNDALRPG